MIAQVLHYDRETNLFEHVADVITGNRYEDEALEYAFYRTQNIEGSWSRSKLIEIDGRMIVNHDFSEDVTTLMPLPVYDGREYGHRSSMVGDRIILDGKIFEVEMFGFKPANVVAVL